MVLFTHAQEEVSDCKRTNGEERAGSTLDPDGEHDPELHAILSRDVQKCVHVELRMRITTCPQALHDWDEASMTFDPKNKIFPRFPKYDRRI